MGYLSRLSRNAQVHCLAVGAAPFAMDLESVVVTELVVSGAPDQPEPELRSADGARREPLDGEEPFDVWQTALLRVLEMWV